MSKNEERAGGNVHPDQRKLTSIQAKRLADLAKVPAKELEGETIARVSERLRWSIDPELLWFRKICGRVVKTDPVSGVEYPVPFATVQVEDTDCSLLGYFPAHAPWGWYFPFHCRREVIGTAKTDACGNFCVWIPRWDIDWVLRWRLQRHCYPIIFQRPDLSDLLRVTKVVEWPPKPPPGDPWFTGTERKRIADALGPAALRKLDGALATAGLPALARP